MLKHRLITGFSAAAIVLAALFLLPAWTHLICIFALFVFANAEFRDIVHGAGHRYEFAAVTIAGALLLLATAVESPVAMSYFREYIPRLANDSAPRMDASNFILALTPAVLLALGVLSRRTERALETSALSFAGFWYVAVLPSFLIRIMFEWPIIPDGRTNYTGRLLLLVFILLVKFGDIGGYTVGCSCGKHKLIPAISPKKTVEGLFGEYAFSLAVGLTVYAILRARCDGMLGTLRFPIVHAVVLPLLLTTTGVLGDLAESLLKRSVGVKDSSAHLPGMGGVLDVLDSLLFSAPFMYAYTVWFLK